MRNGIFQQNRKSAVVFSDTEMYLMYFIPSGGFTLMSLKKPVLLICFHVQRKKSTSNEVYSIVLPTLFKVLNNYYVSKLL